MSSGPHPEYALSQSTATRQNVGETERLISSVGGGALALYGLARRDTVGLLLAAVGGFALYRGATGHCPGYSLLGIDTSQKEHGQSGVKVEKRITIEKSAGELYRYWRNFENLPHFMKHLESVDVDSDGRSHWVAKAPANTTVSWDAEITDDQENERIAWRSLPGSQVMNAGEVRFVTAPGGRGTEVHVSLSYDPPAGALGAVVAKLFGEEPNQQVEGDLRRFKNIMEAGEIPTVEGQSSGRVKTVKKERAEITAEDQPMKPQQLDVRSTVGRASEDSFPASDPSSVSLTPEDDQGIASNERQIGLGKKIY